METIQLLLLLVLGAPSNINCLKLPSYIKPCSRNDPNINECAKQHAIEAIPHFINGDPKYRVPVLEPIHIDEMSVKQGSSNFGLSFTATNLTVKGAKDVKVKEIRIDLKNQQTVLELFYPSIHIDCQYNASGQVLLLPVTGNGNGQMTLKDLNITFHLYFEKVRKTPNDKEYAIPKKFEVTTVPQGMTIHLENLFNGNKLLGDNMNTFLNENWKELIRDLGPVFGEAIGEITNRIVSNIILLVPYDDIFPETV